VGKKSQRNRTNKRNPGSASSSKREFAYTRHWLDSDLLFVRTTDFEDMLMDDPDALDPREEFRDEDGLWDIRFDVRADLKRDAHGKIGQRVVVHDEARVHDVTQLALQAVVHPCLFSFAAKIVLNAADILIAQFRKEGAKALLDAFLADAERFGLKDARSTPVIARIWRYQAVERVFSHAVRTFILGHEIGHYLVQSRRRTRFDSLDNDAVELECDAVGLEAALFFDERYSFPMVEDSEDGPEVDVAEGIGDAWSVFEHLATAVFFGGALLRRADGFLSRQPPDVFPLATRRSEAMITRFRASETGRRVRPLSIPNSMLLRRAFLEIDGLLERTINLDDERFGDCCLPTSESSMAGDSAELEAYFSERLRALGMIRSLGGVLVPESQEGSGTERWLRVLDRATMKSSGPRSRPMLSGPT
jgi:hypothetical protein